jgi:hypothetical protein
VNSKCSLRFVVPLYARLSVNAEGLVAFLVKISERVIRRVSRVVLPQTAQS